MSLDVEVRSAVAGSPAATRVRRLLIDAAQATGTSAREVSVLFCGDRRIRTLNRRYRRKDRPTDVLAFPAGSGEGLLGDIVISVPYAARQARRHQESVPKELDRLLLHGYLHLLGYDHETDDGEMDALEAHLRSRLKVQERE